MAIRDVRWTDEQADAVTETADVLLAASAGTGKTTTVVGKILWMLGLEAGGRGDPPVPLAPCGRPCRLDQIAAITFTEKAAYDLKRKLRAEIEAAVTGDQLRWEIDRASVGTIHGFCGDLLREHSLRLGIDPTFRVLDERETRIQQDEVIRTELKQALEAAEPEARALVGRFKGMYDGTHQKGAIGNVRVVLRDIRWHAARYDSWVERPAKGDPRIDEQHVGSLAGSPSDPAFEEQDREGLRIAAYLYRYAYRSLRRWLSWLEAENARDFDSLILDARRLLTRPETRPALEAVRSQYRILIIDEFQDTDAAQRDIAFAIAGLPTSGAADATREAIDRTSRPQLFLVGDPKQSIYRFRGADIGVWNEVRETLARGGRLLNLSHNFRSEPQIVDFVNRVCSVVMTERAAALRKLAPRSAVDYVELRSALVPTAAGGLEWLANDRNGNDVKDAEGRLVASRIRRLVDGATIRDPESGRHRACRFGDVAILARTREALRGIEPGLRQYGVPYYNSSAGDLTDRQEILDLITVLRLADNPHDDLRAFAFLRSPFVGLRDEVLARIRLDPAVRGAGVRGDGTYLGQATLFLESLAAGELTPFEAPESPLVHSVEAEALRDGLRAIEDAHRLVDRVDHAGILEQVLQVTGYRLHLLLRDHAPEALANIERFQALLDDYRHLPLGGFLRLWDRWGDQDTGIPQASLASRDDDAVTLSTIHTAKGLEWPVVILVGTRGGPDTGGRLSGTFWSDPALGPVFMPSRSDRGARSARLFDTALAEEHAEEARLLYVAATRARDRLLVSGPIEEPKGYAGWLQGGGLEDAIEAHEAAAVHPDVDSGEAAGQSRPNLRAQGEDSVTGTGRQLDAFGFDHDAEDHRGQLSLFAHRAPSSGGRSESSRRPKTGLEMRMVIHRTPDPIQQNLAQLPVHLSWLVDIEDCDPPAITRPIRRPTTSYGTSATELLLRERDLAEWELRYRHGVIPEESFAPPTVTPERLPAQVRGILIHGVLERIEQEAELARILDEAIAGLDAPESETLLEPGSAYRRALEAEIAAVVSGPEWKWYIDSLHWRELPFLHLCGPREWRIGALDLYRPASDAGTNRDAYQWIVDFKTHRIDAEEAPDVAARYAAQATVYREALAALLSAPVGESVRVALHFTHPNVAIEL
jgi:ATP-dependent exoDNAse (exonuclease V) beta subunit